MHDPEISDFYVEKMDMNEGREFIMEHHYSGGCGVAAMIWGLYDERDDELMGACAFQTPCSENVRKSIFGSQPCNCDHTEEEHGRKKHVTELHRLATLDKTPHNTESWFISKALDGLKEYKPKYWAVVSFADQTEGHIGTIYQASNAVYYGTSSPATFYRDQDGKLRHPRQTGENISIQEAKDMGWTPEEREAKHRYLFLLPDPYQDKSELRDMLEIDTDEYPKETLATTSVASAD